MSRKIYHAGRMDFYKRQNEYFSCMTVFIQWIEKNLRFYHKKPLHVKPSA
ncbi:MAG: hypothetical protein LBP54_03265 [Campylobacteraceae bacterium]|nr:hypothetical protein [Campylobacteraceae bacterium]